MTFGWQGFTLDHPDDWHPVSLSGTREEGYARIASAGRQSLQIRWKKSRASDDLRPRLVAYLQRIEKEAKKRKSALRYELKTEDDGVLSYRYTGSLHGRGTIFFRPECSRVFFLEASSTHADALLPLLRGMRDSFDSGASTDRWSFLGLDLELPPGFEAAKKVLQAGRTRLELEHKRQRVVADRWGFAEQLLRKHSLEVWARDVLQVGKAELLADEGDLVLSGGSILPGKRWRARVRHQPELNQITLLKVQGKDVLRAELPPREWIRA